MKKKKVLFVRNPVNNAKFVTNDISFLEEQYVVVLKNISIRKGIAGLITLTLQFYWLLFCVHDFSLIYIWFADYHSFLPVLFSKVFGKKCIICAGGYEATYISEIYCGVFTKETLSKRIRCFAASFSMKHCDLILPVDESLIEHTNYYLNSNKTNPQVFKDGVKAFIPSIKTKFITVAPGYSGDLFKKKESAQKEYSVISAGLIVNEFEYIRKGFDLLINCARKMPDVKFVLIGLNDEYLNKLNSLHLPNLECHGIVSYENLIEGYSKAKVFAQFSLFEGLPSTICEAMCCECIPVGSTVNGIPKIIDGTGFLLEKRDSDEAVRVLKKALECDINLGIKARENILSNFSIQKRHDSILSICNELLN